MFPLSSAKLADESGISDRLGERLERGGVVRRRQIDDREVETLLAQRARILDRLGVVEVGLEPDMRRQRDLLRIAADIRAPGGEHIALTCELFGRAAGEVPVVGVFRREWQGALLAAATDTDGRVR